MTLDIEKAQASNVAQTFLSAGSGGFLAASHFETKGTECLRQKSENKITFESFLRCK